MTKLLVTVSAVIAVSLIAMFWMYSDPSKVASTQTNSSSIPTTAPTKTSPAVWQNATDQFPAAGQIGTHRFTGNPLVEQFITSKNLGAFVEYAKQRPEHGGIYMARKAVALCGGAQKYWASDNPVAAASPLHARAIGALQTRCEGLTQLGGAFSDPLAFMDSLDRFGAERDPLRTAEKRLQAGLFREDKSIDTKKEFAFLLQQGGIVPSFEHFSGGAGVRSVFYLNGKSYAGSDEWALVGAWINYKIEQSMALASDEFGGNEALLFCVDSGGSCEGDSLERATKNTSPELAQKIREIYPQLKKALDSADIDAFSRPARK